MEFDETKWSCWNKTDYQLHTNAGDGELKRSRGGWGWGRGVGSIGESLELNESEHSKFIHLDYLNINNVLYWVRKACQAWILVNRTH